MHRKPTLGAAALAVSASVLALLSGGYQLWRGLEIAEIAATYDEALDILGPIPTCYVFLIMWMKLEAGLSVAATIVLGVGVLCVLVRKSAGRWIVSVGCAVIIEHTIMGWSVTMKMHHWFVDIGAGDFDSGWLYTPNVPVMVLLSFVLPVLASTLLWLPVMRRWWRTNSLDQVASALLAKVRAGLRPPLGTAQCDPRRDLANLTNPNH